MAEVKDIKLKNGIVLSSVTPKNIYDEPQEDKKVFMVYAKDATEKHLTKVFKDKVECDQYFKVYSHDKKNERLPF